MVANMLLFGLMVYAGWIYSGVTGNGKKVEDIIIKSIAWIICHPVTTVAILGLFWLTFLLPNDLTFLNWLYPCWWMLIWSIPILAIVTPIIWMMNRVEGRIMKKLIKKILSK